MLGWLVVAMFALVTGWLVIMPLRKRVYRNNMLAPKHRDRVEKKQSRLNPDSSHDGGIL